MESNSKNSKKYLRRNYFSEKNKEESENSKTNNNYQNSLISEILKNNKSLKLFAIGDYDEYGHSAIVMAETKEEAITKVKDLKAGDVVGVGDTIDNDDIEWYRLKAILRPNKIEEIPSGIYIAENC